MMNPEQHSHKNKFDFWKKTESSDPKATYLSYFQQVLIYWTLLGLLFIFTINVISPVGTKSHMYKPEMTRVIYEDDDAMTRLLRDERTTTKTGEQK